MEVAVRRLLGEAAARPDRQRRAPCSLRARLFTDGGARGNPGPAAYGYVIEAEDGTVLATHGEAIGVATNNVAEYSALIAGLERAIELDVGELEVVSDSELMVKQMRGEYKVKNEALRELSTRASRLARELGSVSYTAVRREHNKLADQLVNDALDAAT
ncbi:MAG TPA: ribonuclease HI family protein [Gaiellaceae bacterium]|nr:ribonuclease HI family protein [Gaiellaceae bacterium]